MESAFHFIPEVFGEVEAIDFFRTNISKPCLTLVHKCIQILLCMHKCINANKNCKSIKSARVLNIEIEGCYSLIVYLQLYLIMTQHLLTQSY